MNRIVTTNPFVGICHMQVCCEKDCTDAEILEHCNRDNPSGTTNGWARIVRDGVNDPGPCADNPDRLHVLAVC